MNDSKVVVDKSTVPVGTAEEVKKIILKELEDRKVSFSDLSCIGD